MVLFLLATARAYKAAGVSSVVVGDHNYGEVLQENTLQWSLLVIWELLL
jgi:hypothetical protein